MSPIIMAALAAFAQQASPAGPLAPPQAQQPQPGNVTEQKNETPLATMPAPATVPTELKPVDHLNNAVTEASRAAGAAVAGPVGAAIAPAVVHGTGHAVKKFVHRRHHKHKAPARP